jgi:DNA (cytosine-5)-methyltransferase 1
MTTAIDLFSGAGGFTCGAVGARVEVLAALNHWRLAVDTHSANHPGTFHDCQDLRQYDFSLLPAHDVGLMSPECKGHTEARGRDKKHHDASRSTAWAVIDCAEAQRAPFMVIENVAEFLDWELYPAWKSALETLGYSVAPHVIDAADHGVPQHRRRVFIVCARSKSPLVLNLPRRSHVPFSSIMEQDNSDTWTSVSELCTATRSRIERGLRTYRTGRFLVRYNGSAVGGLPIDVPIGTLTCVDRFSIVDADTRKARILTVNEFKRAMGFPADYIMPANKKDAKTMLGNAVCPQVATDILNAIKIAA